MALRWGIRFFAPLLRKAGPSASFLSVRMTAQLKVSEVVEDFRVGPVLRADEFAADFTLAVDDICLRGTGGTEGQVALLGFIVDGEKVDLVVGEKLMIGGGVIVKVHPENDDLRHLLLESIEGGKLFQARGAPGGPEIENNDFASIIAEVDGLCAIDDGEVRGSFG